MRGVRDARMFLEGRRQDLEISEDACGSGGKGERFQ